MLDMLRHKVEPKDLPKEAVHSTAQSELDGNPSPTRMTGDVVLLVVAVDSDVLLQSLVRSFHLSISLWVVSGSEMKFHVECNSKGPEKV